MNDLERIHFLKMQITENGRQQSLLATQCLPLAQEIFDIRQNCYHDYIPCTKNESFKALTPHEIQRGERVDRFKCTKCEKIGTTALLESNKRAIDRKNNQ